MKRFLANFLVLAFSAEAFAQEAMERPGDAYRVTVQHSTNSEGNGSSSSSTGGHEYLERVVAVRDDGVERIFDLPGDLTDEQRLMNWHFPVRVLESVDGSLHLLNREEMAARRDAWLSAAELSSDVCGRWYFTWDAFQVECDPEAVLETLRSLDIQPASLADGAPFHHPAAQSPGRLSLLESASAGQRYQVQMALDPNFIHREDARTDVMIGELMKEPVAFEDAYSRRRREKITGVINVVLDAGLDGQVWRRVTSTEFQKVEDGETESRTTSERVERHKLAESTREPAP